MTCTELVIDIETLRLPVTAKDIARAEKEYAPPKNYKDPEKIKAHREEFMKELYDKNAFRCTRNRMIAAALGEIRNNKLVGIDSWCSDDSADIARKLADVLNDAGKFKLIGFNHKSFDWPIVVKHFAEADVSLITPPGKWDLIDLCDYPFRNHGTLKSICAGFGIETPDIDGSDVARLYELGDFHAIQEYNKEDVDITAQLYLIAKRGYNLQ